MIFLFWYTIVVIIKHRNYNICVLRLLYMWIFNHSYLGCLGRDAFFVRKRL